MDYLLLGDALVPASSKRHIAPYPGRTQVRDMAEVVA